MIKCFRNFLDVNFEHEMMGNSFTSKDQAMKLNLNLNEENVEFND